MVRRNHDRGRRSVILPTGFSISDVKKRIKQNDLYSPDTTVSYAYSFYRQRDSAIIIPLIST